ncbi:MAG: L-serine ammonia-lyase, iron-sulfur-dependent subunit beta [Peptococcaceae bacterium]|nr:L-serine ammonia-lyase, iron-sulfur-dependent subunit beta [Peptococcaceae bacterium]
MNVFDILGPVMIGPSSSHTAGAARLGLVARRLAGEAPVAATIYLHGSFAKTYKGHGTDRALVAGILGMRPDDERLRDALTLAEEAGMGVQFIPTDFDDAHPNTAEIHLTDASGHTSSMRGESIGGGNIHISRINGLPVSLSGEYYTLIVIHRDVPGAIAAVTDLLSEAGANICHFDLSRQSRGGEAVMSISVDSIDADTGAALCKKIDALPGIDSCISIQPIG